jgi:hypothetical protein
MPTAYTWQFATLEVYPTYQTVTNAVYNMHWRLIADDGASHTASAYGSQTCGAIDVNNFTPFANLTLSQVQSWLEEKLGANQISVIKAQLNQQIANQITPPTASLPPPWG